MQEIEKLFSEKNCDEILYIESDFTKKELYKIWELARIFGIRYRYITNTFDVTRSNTTLSLINEIAVIEIKNTPLDNWGRILKRLIDLIGSILGIIIFSPIIIITAFLIKLDDFSAPVIYRNRRVGQNGEIFNLYKFRYLKWEYCVKDSYGIEEEKDNALKFEKKLIKEKSKRNGPLYKIHNDPRKTKIGNFIEKYSIDEIPQFFNVFIGDMSLV
jgi:lipopolysaccharide/colanic/teichoic acid biosynthesis glycosyltransferase